MFGMCELDKDFLWGGASAANQMEGGYDLDGRGMSIADVFMFYEKKERHLAKKELTIEEIKNLKKIKVIIFPKEEGMIFIIIIKRILLYWLKWELKLLECHLAGRGFSHEGTRKNPIKQD